MLLKFEGVSRPVSLTNGQALLPVLQAIAGSWPYRRIGRAGADPIITVRRIADGFRIGSPWLEQIAEDDTAVGATCCMLVDLIRAYVEGDPSLLCFHCAAVEIDGRLAMFPNTVRAGKSTLVARLAAEGLRIFADDALPVGLGTRAEGIALGIAPRLRLPLPRRTSADFRAFIESHAGPSDRRYRYLSLPPTLLAGYGSTAPLGAVVLLQRKPSGRAHLAPTRRGQGLQHLIAQNFAPGGTSIAAVDRLHALVARLPCFTLSYSDVDEAAVLLRERLSDRQALSRAVPTRSRAAKRPVRAIDPGDTAALPSEPPVAAECYRQAAGVHLRDVDGDLFLVRPKQDRVFHLDPIAAALWRMLALPTTMAAATGVLCEAFPSVDRRRVARDVRKVFEELHKGGLIQHESPARLTPARTAASAGLSRASFPHRHRRGGRRD